MSEIALYNALIKLGLPPDEAKEAVAEVMSTKNIATKADVVEIKAEIKTEIAKLEARMTWKMVILGITLIGVIKYL